MSGVAAAEFDVASLLNSEPESVCQPCQVIPRLPKPARYIRCVGCAISTHDMDRLIDEVCNNK